MPPTSKPKHSKGSGRTSMDDAHGGEAGVRRWTSRGQRRLSEDAPQSGARLPMPRSQTQPSIIRAVTPEPGPERDRGEGSNISYISDTASLQSSPRSIVEKSRRQGMVFHETFEAGSPPGSSAISPRPRTRTLDDTQRSRISTNGPNRMRVGSSMASGSELDQSSTPPNDRQAPRSIPRSVPESSSQSLSAPGSSASSMDQGKERKGHGKRLLKRLSRPPSPATIAAAPFVDSLRNPVATPDAHFTLLLMKRLSGRMRGEVEYQTSPHGSWTSGMWCIDEVMGNLVQESEDTGPFLTVIIPDLRGCDVRPKFSTERQMKCLEITPYAAGGDIRLIPRIADQTDLWLAALLCWQGLRPPQPVRPEPSSDKRPGVTRRSSTFRGRESKVIKVGTVQLWDKGLPSSPTDNMTRSSTREARSMRCWRNVSCTLQQSGDLKLMSEHDAMPLCVVQLPQLSRRAIQQVDPTVFDEPFCLGIFPRYDASATTLSIIRPIYIALDSRVLCEVWYVLLRAFAKPDLYGATLHVESALAHVTLNEDSETEPELDEDTTPPELFRVENSVKMRIIEAKFRPHISRADASASTKLASRQDPDPTIGDYLAEVILDGEMRARTMTKFSTKNPFWREDCQFYDLPLSLSGIYVVLKKLEPLDAPSGVFRSGSSVNTSDSAMAEVVCGIVDLRLDGLEPGKDIEDWWPILDVTQEVMGEMLLKVRHDELGVLMSREYQPLSDMLHKFSKGLTGQIVHLIPQRLQRFAELFLNVFQASGKATEWLSILVEDEIDRLGKETPESRFRFNTRIGSNDSVEAVPHKDRFRTVRDMGKSLAGEANLLFRGNSLLTQALDCHMRRLGQDYLERVLQDKCVEINEMNVDCEVDPGRVAPGEDMSRNWLTLIQLTTSIWERISISADRCDPQIRQILKYIQAVADDRYGDFLRTVSYTSVTGFLFLRFFCPALLNPKLFGLLRDHPQPRAQRTFTLIAKSLQALANLTMFGQKEAWMVPMNRFLASNRQGLKDFIDKMCSLPTLDAPLALPAPYSTPIQILSRLPDAAREGFPSLPFLIDSSSNFSAIVNLWLDHAEQADEMVLSSDLQAFHDECLSLRARTEQKMIMVEQQPQPWDDTESLNWDDFAGPETSQSMTYAGGLPEDYLSAQSQKLSSQSVSTGVEMPGSAGSDAATSSQPKDRRERQTFWEQTFGKDSKPPAEPAASGSTRNPKNKGFRLGLRRKGGKSKKRRETKSSPSDSTPEADYTLPSSFL